MRSIRSGHCEKVWPRVCLLMWHVNSIMRMGAFRLARSNRQIWNGSGCCQDALSLMGRTSWKTSLRVVGVKRRGSSTPMGAPKLSRCGICRDLGHREMRSRCSVRAFDSVGQCMEMGAMGSTTIRMRWMERSLRGLVVSDHLEHQWTTRARGESWMAE